MAAVFLLLRYFLANFQEESIAQLLDVGLVNCSDARTMVKDGVVECKASNALDVLAGDNLWNFV